MKATAVFCLGPLLACFVSLALPGHSAELKDHVRILPSGATVVLLAGLPGDVESENAYREEMQDWLQIISLSGQIQSVFCLSDFAESLKPPANLAVQFFKSDRSSFQKLGTTLAELTNAVVFIAWGHGGRQGSTPVFHVHGPRLTPADFAGLKFSSLQSHWILMFRGSGAFAAELAGPERMILASESGTMFNSDPISMGLLLKIVRGNPEISFENAAEQLGAASSAWFASLVSRAAFKVLYFSRNESLVNSSDHII